MLNPFWAAFTSLVNTMIVAPAGTDPEETDFRPPL